MISKTTLPGMENWKITKKPPQNPFEEVFIIYKVTIDRLILFDFMLR